MESKKIMWEHAGNKGTFGNAAYVTLTIMEQGNSDYMSGKNLNIICNYMSFNLSHCLNCVLFFQTRVIMKTKRLIRKIS